MIAALGGAPEPPRTNRVALRPLVNTTVAHLLTLAAFVTLIAVQLLRVRFIDDSADGSTSGTATLDRSPKVLLQVQGGAAVAYGVGWLWWAVAAARNARTINSLAVSPGTVPLQVVLSALAIPVIERVGGAPIGYDVTEYLLVVWVINLWVLSLFRHTARSLNADSGEWARLMWLPAVVGGLLSLTMGLVAGLSDQRLRALVVMTVASLGAVAYAFSLHRAMSKWDRSVAARHAQRTSLTT